MTNTLKKQCHLEYDGSFDGFLTLIARAIKEGISPLFISVKGRRQKMLFDNVKYYQTDTEQAKRLAEYLRTISPYCFTLIVHAYLSEDDDVALAAHGFILLSLECGDKVLTYHGNSCVRVILDAHARLLHEVHSFTGFVRFRELSSSVFYAPIEPINNITLLIAEHFTKRLPLQEWLIHDVGRNSALYWDKEGLQSVTVEKEFTEYVRFHGDIPEKTVTESHFQELWQIFHTHIANPARVNKKLQKQFIPQRYWKYLIEKDT